MKKRQNKLKGGSQASASRLLSQIAGQSKSSVAKNHLEEASKPKVRQGSKISSTKNREQGDAHEKDMTDRHQMETTRGSGCGKKEKGDAKDEVWNGQGKSTRGKSISITSDMLDKAVLDARHMDAIPFIDLDFCKEGKVRRPRHWVVVPGPVFQRLKHRLTDQEKEDLKP